MDQAESSFDKALSSSREAESLTGQPGWALLTQLPLVKRDVSAIENLAAAGALSARGGLAAAQAGAALGVDRRGFVSSIYDGGQIKFDALDAGLPFVKDASELLKEGHELLQDAPDPTFGFVQTALDSARRDLASATESAARAMTLVNSLPTLLGKDAARSYLLAFQALGESRGTGGVIGTYGILKTDEGRLRLIQVAPYTDLFPNEFPAVDAPRWFEENYGPTSALKQWPQANLSPNFPAVAKVLLNMYEAQTGKRLDGVIALDPVAFADLMQGIGPLEVSDLDRPITSDNVADVLMHDSYLQFPTRKAQNTFLEHVVRAFWKKVYEGDLEGPSFVEGLADAARTQHLKIFARSAADQQAVVDLGVDGSYERLGPNVQVVFANNSAANKVDIYMSRSIETKIQLESSGAARARTKVTLRNEAPSGPPSRLLGPTVQEIPPGLNRSVFNLLLPKGAHPTGLRINGDRAIPYEYSDHGYTVAWNIVDVAAGKTATATVDYVIPRAAQISGENGEFNFALFPQTTYQPDSYSIIVAPPVGYTVSTDEAWTPLQSGFITTSGTLDQPFEFSLRLTRAE